MRLQSDAVDGACIADDVVRSAPRRQLVAASLARRYRRRTHPHGRARKDVSRPETRGDGLESARLLVLLDSALGRGAADLLELEHLAFLLRCVLDSRDQANHVIAHRFLPELRALLFGIGALSAVHRIRWRVTPHPVLAANHEPSVDNLGSRCSWLAAHRRARRHRISRGSIATHGHHQRRNDGPQPHPLTVPESRCS